MKILWLCNIILHKIANILSIGSGNGGGWLTGLSNDLLKVDDLELVVCFPITSCDGLLKGQVDNLKYYGFPLINPNPTKYNDKIEVYFKTILKEANPDVVHIFGAEFPHTLAMTKACESLGITGKIVINIQGLVSVIAKHYFAGLPNNVINKYSLRDFIKQDNIKKQANKFAKRGEFEVEALNMTNHIIGRTDWDKGCCEQINPKAKYHFCYESC